MLSKTISTILLLSSAILPCTAVPAQNPTFPISQTTFKNAHDALKDAKIIPEVLDDFTPSCYLNVFYPRKLEEVFMGNHINPSHTDYAPDVKVLCPFAKSGEVNMYTVALTDPDVPSRDKPKGSEMCHWIATIPGAVIEGFSDNEIGGSIGSVIEGLGEVVEYKPPAPPKKTGPHRYVFVLLKGDNTNVTAPSDRSHWGTGKARHGVRDWAKNEGLEVVAANFFYAEHKKQ